MANYKIANIKWLRDQGWDISSSYASGLCPTYNAIVNEIPKGSITVNVNGTCIATSKAYSSNQLVCENDITINTVDCSQYQVGVFPQGSTGITDNTGCGGRQPNISATTSALTLSYLDGTPDWMYYSGIQKNGTIYMHFVEWEATTSTTRSGTPIFRTSDGCLFTGQTIYQNSTCTEGGGDGYWFEATTTGGYPTQGYGIPLLVTFEYSGGHSSAALTQEHNGSTLSNFWKTGRASGVLTTLDNFSITNVLWNNSCSCSFSYTTTVESGKNKIKITFDSSSCYP